MQNDCLALYVAMVENDAARRVRFDPKSGLTSQPTRPWHQSRWLMEPRLEQ